MRIAFLIAAHAYPELLLRLVRKLQGPVGSIYVHIDGDVDIRPFKALFKREGICSVRWVPRVSSRWGTYGQVRASLRLLGEALRGDKDTDMFMLLSGQDYPLCPPEKMAAFFDGKKGMNFIVCAPLPRSAWLPDGGWQRLTTFHFAFRRYRLQYPCQEVPGSRRMRIAYRACRLLLPRARPLPKDIDLYGGSSWWNLTRGAAQSIFQYLRCNPDFVRRFRFTLSSDEIFFQTICMNLGWFDFDSDSLRNVFWNNGRGEYPGYIRMENYAEIEKSGKLFTRKVHPQESLGVLDMIDRELLVTN
jgi:Core-2/I-Branching enzyme